jgi:hypothetical protein
MGGNDFAGSLSQTFDQLAHGIMIADEEKF